MKVSLSNDENVLKSLVNLGLLHVHNAYASKEYVFDASGVKTIKELSIIVSKTEEALRQTFKDRLVGTFVTRTPEVCFVVIIKTELRAV